jgi:metallophosphoesterase superfamily enzyme
MRVGLSLTELRPGLFAHASGAAWLAESRTVLVADLHLGYAWAQRRRGELGPVTTGGVERKLLGALDELEPRRIVLLGDLVHAPRPSAREFAFVAETLHQMRQRAELILLAGNHDRGLTRDYGLTGAAHWQEDGWLAAHGDVLPPPALQERCHCLYGHWHPTVLMRDAAGVNRRYAAFLTSERATVLPAFSPFARGLDARGAWPAELRQALGEDPVRLVATSGRSLAALPVFTRPGAAAGGRARRSRPSA